MAFITQDEDKKKLRTLKDVKRDLRDTVKSSRKYTPKERENKAKLYKELTDMGGKSKHASYWKKFLPKKVTPEKGQVGKHSPLLPEKKKEIPMKRPFLDDSSKETQGQEIKSTTPEVGVRLKGYTVPGRIGGKKGQFTSAEFETGADSKHSEKDNKNSYRIDPATGNLKKVRGRTNLGVDFVPDGPNKKISAHYPGILINKKKDPYGYGNTATIETDATYTYKGKEYPVLQQYGHAKSFNKKIKPGERLKRGQSFGKVGNTGSSSGAHLDLRTYIKVNGKNVDLTLDQVEKQQGTRKGAIDQIMDFNAPLPGADQEPGANIPEKKHSMLSQLASSLNPLSSAQGAVRDPGSLERSPDVPTRPSLPEDPLAPKPYPDEGQETENITNAIEAVHGTSQFSGKADKGISFQEEPLDSIQIEAAKEHMGAKNAPPEMRDQAGKELKNPQEQKRIKEQSKVGGNVTPMDQLKEALLYFGPQIAASILGGAEAGEATSRIMEGVRKHSLEKEKLAIERESKLGQKGIASENLKIKKANLAARLAEIEDQRKRTNNLQEDRRLRKAERELNREKKYLDFTDKQKEMFSNRNDVKTYRERKNKYQAILNLTNFKEGQQLPGGINALIARSVSGEVGVLTDADVQRAQINPDLISKLKRGYFTNIRGTMSPKDTEDIKLLVRKIMAKDDEIMKEKAGLYTQAKKKWLPEKYQKSFKEDLITGGLGIDITKKVKPKLTPDQRKRLEYLRAKHRK